MDLIKKQNPKERRWWAELENEKWEVWNQLELHMLCAHGALITHVRIKWHVDLFSTH